MLVAVVTFSLAADAVGAVFVAAARVLTCLSPVSWLVGMMTLLAGVAGAFGADLAFSIGCFSVDCFSVTCFSGVFFSVDGFSALVGALFSGEALGVVVDLATLLVGLSAEG